MSAQDDNDKVYAFQAHTSRVSLIASWTIRDEYTSRHTWRMKTVVKQTQHCDNLDRMIKNLNCLWTWKVLIKTGNQETSIYSMMKTYPSSWGKQQDWEMMTKEFSSRRCFHSKEVSWILLQSLRRTWQPKQPRQQPTSGDSSTLPFFILNRFLVGTTWLEKDFRNRLLQ